MKHQAIFGSLLLISLSLSAQHKALAREKGSLYFGFGFHRIFYSGSDIHFRDQKTADYDFTLFNVKAGDDNSFNFGEGIDAPQYSYRTGYYFNKKRYWR